MHPNEIRLAARDAQHASLLTLASGQTLQLTPEGAQLFAGWDQLSSPQQTVLLAQYASQA
jgi:hypothetical protein